MSERFDRNGIRILDAPGGRRVLLLEELGARPARRLKPHPYPWGACWLCGSMMRDVDRSRDHVVPLSEGGKSVPSNIRLAHRTCNSNRQSYTAASDARTRLTLLLVEDRWLTWPEFIARKRGNK